jgi:cell division septum initiation protein DivIVA
MHARVLLLVLLPLLSAAVTAQEVRRPGSDATARLQQQLAGERTALQAENARLKDQVGKLEQGAKSLTTEKESLARQVSSAESKASRTQAGERVVSSRLESAELRLNEVVGKYKELAEQLRNVEIERTDLSRQAAVDSQALKVCAEKNVQLAGIAGEALDRYENKGFFSALADAEPFTRLKRVEVENAVEAYRQQVESLKVAAPAE